MSKYIKIAVALIFFGSILTIIYFQLGGGTPIEYEVVTQDITVYGKSFSGKYNDPKLETLFTEARNQVLSHPGELLAIVNYASPHPDTVNQFIGFISAKGYNKPSVEMKEVTFVKTVINAHNLVMPKPDEVRAKTVAFALSKGLKLDDLTVEIYREESKLEVLFPCKAN